MTQGSVVNRYEKSLKNEGPAGDDYEIYDFWTMLIMPWITNFSILLFMILGGLLCYPQCLHTLSIAALVYDVSAPRKWRKAPKSNQTDEIGI